MTDCIKSKGLLVQKCHHLNSSHLPKAVFQLNGAAQLSSALIQLYSLGTSFGFPLAKAVANTWYLVIWYHLGQGSKKAEPILKGGVKTLHTTGCSEGIG